MNATAEIVTVLRLKTGTKYRYYSSAKAAARGWSDEYGHYMCYERYYNHKFRLRSGNIPDRIVRATDGKLLSDYIGQRKAVAYRRALKIFQKYLP